MGVLLVAFFGVVAMVPDMVYFCDVGVVVVVAADDGVVNGS